MTLGLSVLLFIGIGIIIAVAGYYLVRLADQLADITGIGEAFFGAVLLGAITSLAGIITSVSAAYQGHPELSISNALGGIAAQTLFLALADFFHKKANLEHSSASYENLLVGLLLIIMLCFTLMVVFSPEISVFKVHPASIVLLLIYYAGNSLIQKAKKVPMWYPRSTLETVQDKPDAENLKKTNLYQLWLMFIGLAIVVGLSGYGIAELGISIAGKTGLSEGLVGSLFTAVVTSFPELIVTIAAIRQGALTLAVANIIGGNSFDILFLSFSDIAFREGSIYHAFGQEQIYVLLLTLMLTAILISGLLIRQKEGIIKIGWETALIIITFISGYLTLYA